MTSSPAVDGKTGIAIAAADLDGDGLDELAITSCNDPVFSCVAGYAQPSTSEIALYEHDLGGLRFEYVSSLPEETFDGGFRRLSFVDLNQDGNLDLVSTNAAQVVGYCGDRRAIHYGFDPMQRFSQNLTFGQSWAIASGSFAPGSLPTVVATGGLRQGGAIAGFALLPGCVSCASDVRGQKAPCGVSSTPTTVTLGPKTYSFYLDIAVADLNQDGHDDILVLERDTHVLYTYLGDGSGSVAKGPSIPLPTALTGALAVATEKTTGQANVVAATMAPLENQVLIVRFKP
jgi:hypothetical protein